MKRIRYAIPALLLTVLLGGCSGIPTYSDTLPKNLHVRTELDSGSALRSVVAEFDVHRVNAACQLKYEGRVYLYDASTDVGIPVDELIYLDFIFASKAFLSSHISGTRYRTLINPRSGYDYQAEVKYNKGIYSVVIREARHGSSNYRVLEQRPLGECKQTKSDK
ncbi:MAG TPA: hypothetical protein VFF81_06825 [Noviherbaspirillum sp.]|nr:hypothetical protein [Noviherbaspirillum sp.]